MDSFLVSRFYLSGSLNGIEPRVPISAMSAGMERGKINPLLHAEEVVWRTIVGVGREELVRCALRSYLAVGSRYCPELAPALSSYDDKVVVVASQGRIPRPLLIRTVLIQLSAYDGITE